MACSLMSYAARSSLNTMFLVIFWNSNYLLSVLSGAKSAEYGRSILLLWLNGWRY
jgi:hypothetical protein